MPAEDQPDCGVATIRRFTPDDLPHAQRMLSQRDQRPWDAASTAWFLQGFDPQRCWAWGAVDGDKPVGFTSFFLRTLATPEGPVRAAYWANLFVDPAYRSQMLYPRLPMTMFRGLKEAGAEFLYAAVRLRDVAQAHTKIGFGVFGDRHVLVRFLRPGRFLRKHKGLPAATGLLSGPLDAAYGGALRLRSALSGSHEVNDLPADGAPHDWMARRLEDRQTNLVAQQWTADQLRDRYRQTREGGEYRFLVAGPRDDPRAVLVYRFAERGAGVRIGVVMDLVHRPGGESAAAAALRRLEKNALAEGCELLMLFDGLGPEAKRLATRCGFRSSPEKYTFMVYPKKKLDGHAWLGDAAGWAYTFGDHDAF